ncbi:hypothetical protein B0H14DRAFT_983777 [Mycena olivaceomarginata]|nr:hypothetical protein B0H14DRAFT_983777 [Mycena olivaceomarginata]
MTPPAWESFQHSLPAAPGVDAKQIRGNIPDKEKQVNANVLAYFTTGSGVSPFPPFSSEIGGRLKIVSSMCGRMSAQGAQRGRQSWRLRYGNVYGTMHGGCAAYMLDPATVASVILLGRAKGFDGTGVSQNMNVHWHHPASLGATLTITTRSVFADGRARLARCEMRDKSTGKLIVSGSHAFLNAGRATKL